MKDLWKGTDRFYSQRHHDSLFFSPGFELPAPTTENITACGKSRTIERYNVSVQYFEVAMKKLLALDKPKIMLQLRSGEGMVHLKMVP